MIKINVDDRKLWEPIKWFWRLIVRLRVGDHCLIQYTKGFFAKKFERYDLRSNWTVASWFKIEWIWVTDYIPNIRRKVRVMLGQAVQPGLSLFWWCGALRSCYSPLPMIPILRAGLNLKVRELCIIKPTPCLWWAQLMLYICISQTAIVIRHEAWKHW